MTSSQSTLEQEAIAIPRPVLLLVPGLMCDAAVWQAQCAGLADLAECVVVDHGEADSLDGMARQALACVPGGRSFALAGHSMGGRVALEMLRLAPERVERLALMDTGYQARPAGAVGEAEAAQRFALLALAQRDGMRTMGQQWSQAMVHPDRLGGPVHEAILQMIARATPQRFAAQINALLARPDATGVLRNIQVPALLLCGRDDSWSPLARHIDMQALVPHAALSVVEHSGHMSTMEQPEAVTQAMRQWLLSTVPDSQNTSQISL